MKVSCPNCGSNIKFIPNKQKFLCENCGKFSGVEKLNVEDYFNESSDYSECTCSSCGSKLITGNNDLIMVCAYCGSKQIIKEKYLGNFQPQKIIPFKHDEHFFRNIFHCYLDTKKFAPNSFLKDTKINNVKGIYVPFVMYKVECNSYARGEGADEVVSKDDDHYSKIYYCKYFEMRYKMDGTITFDTSTKIEDEQMKAIGPFDFSMLEDFNPAYLNGFSAEYGSEKNLGQKLVDEIVFESNEIIDDRITEINENGYINHKIMDLKTKEVRTCHIYNGGYNRIDLKVTEIQHVLLPVFMYNCSYKGVNYKFLINGQTGKMIGEVPVDFVKVFKNVFYYTFWMFIIFVFIIIFFKTSIALIIVPSLNVIMFSISKYYVNVNKYKINSYDNKNTFLNKMVTFYQEYNRNDYNEKFKSDYLNKHLQIINNGKLYYDNVSKNKYDIERNTK